MSPQVLMDMFYQESELTTSETSGGGSERRGRRGSLSYAELVRDLLTDEKHFLRDLNLIIRVFKDELEKILDKDSRVCILYVLHLRTLVFLRVFGCCMPD